MSTTPNGIHAAVLHAQRLCAEQGIAKDSNANMGGSQVAFRGVEAAMNALSAILTVSGITHTPRTLSCEVRHDARAEAGKFIRIALVKCEFRFEHEDGSFQIAETYGEASDFNDKAVTKAQSVALRIALFNKFLVPTAATSFDTEGDGDDDRRDDDSPIDGKPAMTRERDDGQAPPPPAPRGGPLPPYPKEKFEKNLPGWIEDVESGKLTGEAIIAKLQTVGTLNPVQTGRLKSLKRK